MTTLISRGLGRDHARSDPGWLDLATAEASGFVHRTASAERLVATDPDAIDEYRRRLQFVLPRKSALASPATPLNADGGVSPNALAR